MKPKPLFFAMLTLAVLATSCNSNDSKSTTTTNDTTMTTQPSSAAQLKEENVTYTEDTVTANGYIVYDAAKEGKRPAVLVVHEWWGQNDYTRSRAKQLAELGYIAMAVDMYGDGKTAANPKEAEAMAMPFYKNPQMTLTRLEAAMNKLKTYPQVDTANMAAIGYCYGGFVVLNAAKLGAPLKGVVSFHGNLSGVQPKKDLLKANILVAHGAADKFVSEAEVAAFKKSMDSIGANYTFKAYPNATHAFTNPAATETGKKFNMPIEYNGAADTASWNDMKAFFATIFK
ncbi:dienelactone hydrolase family protein [Flavisolibacter tropicus]|uniref:Dienelactone hydrolase n=1 Tax=Flavisolibacter tropicus TaxID=1492898 RepID=A0A172TY00_9BACT|nr:dienelactone hydrolase family protein [Flavisolibacter tropicus]ANE51754.1 dienelactone hydrolase [Flavisolibacter tropicus]